MKNTYNKYIQLCLISDLSIKIIIFEGIKYILSVSFDEYSIYFVTDRVLCERSIILYLYCRVTH